jgi:biotin transport system ATP-binding protein
MIEIKHVSHDFDGLPILQDIDVRLAEKRIAIIGANGSGKTTLARMLNGLVLPRKGEVLVDGISTAKDVAKVRRLVGFVFQNPEHQIVMPTVEEDIAFGLHNMNLPKAEIAKRVDAILAAHHFTEKRAAPAYLLSGGEQKLLSLISVLVMGPRYVIFDEPLNSLDLATRRRFTRLMHDLPQTTVTITHDFELIADYDRALLIHEGRLAADGVPREVIARYVALVEAAESSPSSVVPANAEIQ